MTSFKGEDMPKKLSPEGTKNLIGKRVKELRAVNHMSQEDLMGYNL